ncbi:Pro-kumamolisin [Seiridium cupressi]
MDPVTAFGIASNAIALIDFASKLVSKTYRIYTGTGIDLEQNAIFEYIANDLTELANESVQWTSSNAREKLSKAERQLDTLSHEAQAVSKKLLSATTRLLSMPRTTRWGSFVQALACVWSESEVKQLEQDVDRIRKQLDTTLLMCLRQQIDRLESASEKWEGHDPTDLGKKIQTFMMDCRDWQTNLLSELYRHDWNPTRPGDVDAFSTRLRYLTPQETLGFTRGILQRLHYGQLVSREAEICPAYRKTYEWIFDGAGMTERGAADYTTWLKSNNGANIYWITGKAGSGKSTLMKFIFQNPRTKQILQNGDWGKSHNITIVPFCFWNPGSQMQKSREGLLRTLLYGTLQVHKSMITRVFAKRWAAYTSQNIGHWDWTWAELKDAFETMISEASERLVFFVNGLDELDGAEKSSTTKETQDVLQLLIRAGQLAHVKICVSSRPWLIFEDAFESEPSLTMDRLNHDDILLYVTGKFEGNTHFAKLQEKQPAFASQLMRDIVQKSAAVFFWVYLVVHSLLRGLSNSDRISDLQRRLNELPSELEALFEKILSNLEPFYYTHACQLFQIFEGYNEVISERLYIFEEHRYLPMSSLAMSFADDNDPTAAFTAEVKALSLKDSNARGEEIRRRLNSRCQGLLEATENRSTEDMVPTKVRDLPHSIQPRSIVRYLHRTTGDFIREPRTWRKIVIATGPSFDPFILITNSALYQLKTLNMSSARPNHLMAAVVRCCFAVCNVRSKDPIFTAKYLDEVEKTERSLVQKARANGQSLVNKQPGDSTEQTWTSAFTAYRVPSLLDFAITTPGSLTFSSCCMLETESYKQINITDITAGTTGTVRVIEHAMQTAMGDDEDYQQSKTYIYHEGHYAPGSDQESSQFPNVNVQDSRKLCRMLFRQLAVAVTSGLVLGAVASPLSNPGSDAVTATSKREVPATHGLHERQAPHWRRQWEKKDKVPARALLPMRIGLAQRNLDVGARHLAKISDPRSSDYGKHMSSDEVIEMFAPSEDTVKAVKEWLVGAGFAAEKISLSANKQWVQFDAHAEEVEELLATDYFQYEHSASGSKMVGVEEYHVPLELRDHIDYITPGVKLRADPGKLRTMKRRQEREALKKREVRPMYTNLEFFTDEKGAATGLPPLNSTVCDMYVTADCIRTQYSIPNNTLATPGNELGIFESLDDHYSKEDLDTFFATLYPYIPQGTYPEERLVDGAIGAVEDVPGYTQEDAGVESDLDFEAAWPLIWPQKTVLFQTDDEYYEINQTEAGTPYFGFYNTFFDAIDGSYCTYSAYNETGDCTDPACLDPVYPDPNPGGYTGQLQCGVYEPTNVITISYGGGEADLPAYYLKRQCNEIMKLGLQGVSVLESSGDYGVASFPGDFGYENGCAGPDGTVFYPSADATCPYVLAVGSTQFNHVNETTYYESSTDRFYSGGGFSNYFDAPDWQTDAISAYFDEVTLNFTGYEDAGTNFSDVGDGVYKIGGRGYPDVSAIGDYYVVFTEGVWARVGGTSLSSPIWGAVLTLVNEQRIAANKSTVGFIQPTLYAHPEVFTDITEGSNPGCDSSGFPTASGWDPVSGLGTPIFPKLVDLLLSL